MGGLAEGGGLRERCCIVSSHGGLEGVADEGGLACGVGLLGGEGGWGLGLGVDVGSNMRGSGWWLRGVGGLWGLPCSGEELLECCNQVLLHRRPLLS